MEDRAHGFLFRGTSAVLDHELGDRLFRAQLCCGFQGLEFLPVPGEQTRASDRLDTLFQRGCHRNDPPYGLAPVGDLHDLACLSQPEVMAQAALEFPNAHGDLVHGHFHTTFYCGVAMMSVSHESWVV